MKKQEAKFKEVYTKKQQETFCLQEKLKDISVDYEGKSVDLTAV